jgi:hypothetical protein
VDLKSVICVIVGGILKTMCDTKKENCLMLQKHRLEFEKMSKDQLLQQLIYVEDVQFRKHSGNKRKRHTSGVDINESN